MKNKTRHERKEQAPLSPEVLRVLEEYLELDPSDRARHDQRLYRWITSDLRYRRKMTPEQFCTLYLSQNKRCAICNMSRVGRQRKLHFDHDHKTLLLRGLLCFRCNGQLGQYQASRERFEAYLDSPPARRAGLTVSVEGHYWRKVPPHSPETLARLQSALNRGTPLTELWNEEPDLPPVTVAKYIRSGLLHLPDDTITQIRNELANGRPRPQIAKAVGIYRSTLDWLLNQKIVTDA